MKESTTYQAILEEGRQEGQKIGMHEGVVVARRDTLLAVLRDRFPTVSNELKSAIELFTDSARLQGAIIRAIHIDRIEDLQL